MKPKLDESISSLQDLKGLTLEIRNYASWFAHNYIKKRVHARNTTEPPAISPAARLAIREWASDKALTTKSLDELVKTLEEYGRTAPSLTITLAAVPPASLKKTLVGWCRNNIAPNVLIDFQFSSTLLGGMVVRSGSRVFDWSFRRQILAQRNHFPEVLRRV